MPLHTSQLPAAIAQAPSPAYLIFWASGSPSWCPDCRNAEPAVHAVFGTGPNDGTGGPSGYMIYVGDRPTWKDPNNQYRTEYNIQSVPTIVRWENGKETGRIEDAECQDEGKLQAFIDRNLYRVSPTALIPSGSVAGSHRASSSFRPTQPREPPGMKAVMSADSLKSFNHALTCLSKFGDNLCMQATRTEDGTGMLRLSTINSSSSAFAAFFFYLDFFEELNVRLREDYEPTKSAQRTKIECQLHAKALGSILKSRLNRGLERCEIHIIQPWSGLPTGTDQNSQFNGNALEARLLLRLHCAHGVVKTHKLTYEPKKSLYPTANPFPGAQFIIGPRTASEWLDHFLSSKGGSSGGGGAAGSSSAPGPAGEVSLHCGPEFCIVKNKEVDLAGRLENRLGDTRGTLLRSIQTQVRIELQEFISYDVNQVIHLTFPLKEFKAAIALAESLGLSLEIRFGINDQPLFILLSNAPQIPTASNHSSMPRPTYEQGQPTLRAEFVLATTQEPDPADTEGGADAAPGAGVAAANGAGPTAGAGPSAKGEASQQSQAARGSQQAAAHSNDGQPMRSTAGSGSLPPPEALLRKSQGAGSKRDQSRANDGGRGDSQQQQQQPVFQPPSQGDAEQPLFQPSQGEDDEDDFAAFAQMEDDLNRLEEQEQEAAASARAGRPAQNGSIGANGQGSAQASGIAVPAPSHGRFVLNSSQVSNREAEEALLAQLRTDPPSYSTPVAAGAGNGNARAPAPSAAPPGSMAPHLPPTQLMFDDEDAYAAEAETGTPWGATAAMAADAAAGVSSSLGAALSGARLGSPSFYYGAESGQEQGQGRGQMQDVFIGDEVRGVSDARGQRRREGQRDERGRADEETEDQDEDEDPPPTPPAPGASDEDDEEEEDDDDTVERLRRRKKYRPIF
ncbi:hypothetical protein OC834_006527 [Tilletia horrida]|nr:hypothetical protein OC834_006527 [Tilletia horrida]